MSKNLDMDIKRKICIGFIAVAAYDQKVDLFKKTIFSVEEVIESIEKIIAYYDEYNQTLDIDSNFDPKDFRVIDHRNIYVLHNNLLGELKELSEETINQEELQDIISRNCLNSSNNNQLLESNCFKADCIITNKQYYEIFNAVKYLKAK